VRNRHADHDKAKNNACAGLLPPASLRAAKAAHRGIGRYRYVFTLTLRNGARGDVRLTILSYEAQMDSQPFRFMQ
jgi:hypothetical protein